MRLTDKAMGIEDQPLHDLDERAADAPGLHVLPVELHPPARPGTGREDGPVQSVLQVATDPGRHGQVRRLPLVVLGAFVQFYMRAGLFSDGGKREREGRRQGQQGRPGERAAGRPGARSDPRDAATSTRTDEPDDDPLTRGLLEPGRRR